MRYHVSVFAPAFVDESLEFGVEAEDMAAALKRASEVNRSLFRRAEQITVALGCDGADDDCEVCRGCIFVCRMGVNQWVPTGEGT